MQIANVLLIQPPPPSTFNFEEPFMPLGIAYIAAVLEKHNVEVHIIDLAVAEDLPESINCLMERVCDYEVVGITCTTVTYLSALDLARKIKARSPRILIVMGGPHVTFTAEETLREDAVDFVVRGEGEYAMLELIYWLVGRFRLEEISGLTYKWNGKIRTNRARKNYIDLDRLPVPARHLLVEDKYLTPAIIASRGCAHRCSFCSATAMYPKYAIRSPESIVSELANLDASKMIAFYDNTFSGSLQRACRICQEIISAGLKINWTCEMRVDNVTRSLLEKMFLAGCKSIHFGIESGSDEVLESMNKRITVAQAKLAIKSALDTGIGVSCSFTIGHPHDTEETINKTIILIKEIQELGASAAAAIVTPFPGTPIYNRAAELGLTIREKDWSKYTLYRPIMSTPHLSRQRIGELFAKLLLETGSYLRAQERVKLEKRGNTLENIISSTAFAENLTITRDS